MSEINLTPELIRAALTTVKYPGFSRDIVAFGLVKNIEVSPEGRVVVDLRVESKNSDVPRYIYERVMSVLQELPGVTAHDVRMEHHAPEQKKAEREAAKLKKQKEREARWAELDKRDAEKAKAKEEKRKEKERAKKRKALKDMAKQAQKDAETLEKYRLKFEKQKAREAEKAARKKKKKRE